MVHREYRSLQSFVSGGGGVQARGCMCVQGARKIDMKIDPADTKLLQMQNACVEAFFQRLSIAYITGLPCDILRCEHRT